MNDRYQPRIEGFVKIFDLETGEVLVDCKNAVNMENMSYALALSLADRSNGHINEMVFGNGGSTVNGIGTITYFPPNVTGINAQLYNETYSKIVDDLSPLQPGGDAATNNMTVLHTIGTVYSDIVVTCTLGFDEPSGQDAFDDSQASSGLFIFDELGLKSYNPIPDSGPLLTHVVFHPIDKSLNRVIQIIYTLRIYMT